MVKNPKRTREDSHLIREEMARLEKVERKSIREIAEADSDQAYRLAKTYRKAFDELFLEYEEKCPEEGGREDTIIGMQLESYEKLLRKAKERMKELQKEEAYDNFSRRAEACFNRAI